MTMTPESPPPLPEELFAESEELPPLFTVTPVPSSAPVTL